MAWTAIAASQTDADSPIDEDLMDAIRGNLDHIFDGTDISTDLVTSDSIAAGAVKQGELSSSTESQSGTCAAGTVRTLTFTATAGYGFRYSHSMTVTAGVPIISANPGAFQITTTTANGFRVYFSNAAAGGNDGNVAAASIYVTATRPHPLLSAPDWGLWLYAVLDPSGDIVRASLAEDPPGYMVASSRALDGFGRPCARLCRMLKRNPLLHLERPHPFVEEFAAGDFPTGSRVVLLDLRALEEDSPERWRPDVAERNRVQAMAATLPPGDQRTMMETYAAELSAEVQARDVAMEQAERALRRAPATVDELAMSYADLEVTRLRRMLDRLMRRVEQIDEALSRDDLPEARRSELMEARAEHMVSASRVRDVRIPQAERDVPTRLTEARERAEGNLPVIRRRLRAAAGYQTKADALLRAAMAHGGGQLRALLGGPAQPMRAWDIAAGDFRDSELPEAAMHGLVDAALGGIPADSASHPDNSDARKLPGLFTPKSAGEKPAVTILSPR